MIVPMKNQLPALLFFAALFSVACAQPLLTPDQAVSIALKNNYGIQVAQNDADIARLNNTAGNAGMLPFVALTGSDLYSLNSDQQLPLNGGNLTTTNPRPNSLSAGARLDWTVFDGGKMFVTKQKLSEIESLGAIQYKDKVLQTTYSVIVAYYDVVRQKQQLASINEVLTYNQERVTIAKTSFGAGLSPKTTLLQAQVDLNVYKENAINQQTAIGDAKRTLNRLLSRDVEAVFEVADSIPLAAPPDKSLLFRKLDSNNTSILSVQKQVDVARLSLRENRALLFPKVAVNLGYALSQNDNAPGTYAMSRSYGPQVGGSISIPVFQGGNAARQVETAKLQLESAQYNLQDIKQEITAQLQNALADFDGQQQLLQIEKENNALAKENMDISMQRLRYGQSTSLELRQAEESYEDSRTRLLSIEYNLKVVETKLKQLMAGL